MTNNCTVKKHAIYCDGLDIDELEQQILDMSSDDVKRDLRKYGVTPCDADTVYEYMVGGTQIINSRYSCRSEYHKGHKILKDILSLPSRSARRGYAYCVETCSRFRVKNIPSLAPTFLVLLVALFIGRHGYMEASIDDSFVEVTTTNAQMDIEVPLSYPVADAEKYFIHKDELGLRDLGGLPPVDFPGGPVDKEGSLKNFAGKYRSHGSFEENETLNQRSLPVNVNTPSLAVDLSDEQLPKKVNDTVGTYIDPSSLVVASIEKEGYELVFSDEFNGSSLDVYRWHSQLKFSGKWNSEKYDYRIINGEDQFYVDVLSADSKNRKGTVATYNPFVFDGSSLTIKAINNPLRIGANSAADRLDDTAHQQHSLSGAISTHDKFSLKYGYFEARIKIPENVGMFPAFWLFHSRLTDEGAQSKEVDIMETLEHYSGIIYHSNHYSGAASRSNDDDNKMTNVSLSAQLSRGIDYSKNFHTYSIEWEPGKITWFVDGKKTNELKAGDEEYEKLYDVTVNLAVDTSVINLPEKYGGVDYSNGVRFPRQNVLNDLSDSRLEVDYVRVYRRI